MTTRRPRRGPRRRRWPEATSRRSISARSIGTSPGWRSLLDPADHRMLSRVVIALVLAAAVVSGGALAFLRTDFVANNLCTYAVATIEEATQAQVKVARCSVEPAVGKLTIDGLQVGVPGGRIDLKVARVFVQVIVRPLLQRVR